MLTVDLKKIHGMKNKHETIVCFVRVTIMTERKRDMVKSVRKVTIHEGKDPTTFHNVSSVYSVDVLELKGR